MSADRFWQIKPLLVTAAVLSLAPGVIWWPELTVLVISVFGCVAIAFCLYMLVWLGFNTDGAD